MEKVIQNKKDYNTAIEIFKKYDHTYSKQIEFWECAYFKLGMIDREKIRNEFFKEKVQLEENDTLLNSCDDDLSEYIEKQKKKYTFETKEYKELRKKYRKIA